MNVEIITMVYKSTKFVDFIAKQLLSCKSDLANVHLRIICNDATDAVIDRVKQTNIPYSIYKDDKPNDYYLNRVYRAWNYGGFTSKFENIIFVNSDMAFSDGWIDALLRYHSGNNIPCSRLVESGKLEVGAGIPNRGWAAAYNLGTTPDTFRKSAWQIIAKNNKSQGTGDGGLYMPCLFKTDRFKRAGGYPEGNIYTTGVGKFGDPFVKSGDDYFFHDVLEKQFDMRHITVFDSLVYHMQEGERDD